MGVAAGGADLARPVRVVVIVMMMMLVPVAMNVIACIMQGQGPDAVSIAALRKTTTAEGSDQRIARDFECTGAFVNADRGARNTR